VETANPSLLTFPCSFPIKAMGKADPDFKSLVMDIMRQHVAKLDDCDIKMSQSAQANYLSITITIEAQSQAQIDGIYLALTANPRILMAL